MQQQQNENWQDLLGVYTGILQGSSSNIPPYVSMANRRIEQNHKNAGTHYGPVPQTFHQNRVVSSNPHQQRVISPNFHQNGAIPPNLRPNVGFSPHLLRNGVRYPNTNQTEIVNLRQNGIASPNLRQTGMILSNSTDRNMQYTNLSQNASVIGSEVQNLPRTMAPPQKVNSFAELLGTMTPVTNGQSSIQSQGFESNQTPYKPGKAFLQQNHILHGSCSTSANNLPPTTNIRRPVPARPEYKLNFPPRSASFESSGAFTLLNRLWPSTSGQEKQPKNHQITQEQVLRADGIPNQDKGVQANGLFSRQPDIAEKNSNKFTQTTLGTSIPRPSKEKNIFDGGNEVINLNKTPKRKKHRPKVVKEVKPKTAKKPDATKDTPDGKPREKRKYVRRKGVETSNTPRIDTTEEGEVCDVESAAKRGKVPFDLNLASNNTECSAETNIRSTLAPKEPQKILEQQTGSLYRSVHSVEQTPGGSVQFTSQQLAPKNHALDAIARSWSFRNTNPSPSLSFRNANHSLTNIGKTDTGNSSGGGQTILHSKGNVRINCSVNIKKRRTEDEHNGNTGLISEITNAGDNSGPSIKRRSHNYQARSSTLCESSNSEANKTAHQPDKIFAWNKSHHPVGTQSSVPMTAVPGCNQAEYTQRNEVLQSPASVPAKSLIEQKSPNTVSSVENTRQKDTGSSRGYGNSTKTAKGSRGKKKKDLSTNTTGKKIVGRQENSLVPYARDRGIVAYKDSKGRVPRPKVQLDPGTNRFWNLLMGNENAEEVDIDKRKWWEAERKLFHGRVENFISRMHPVQGDRRFSEWKGSVVDSAIGTFFTHSVSDHVSSSAFMSLAAKFPLKPRTDKPECSRNGEHNQVRVTFPDETMDDYKSLLVNSHSRTEADIISSQSSPELYQAFEEIRSSSVSNSETEEQLMERHFNLNDFPDTVSEQAGRAAACPHQFQATEGAYAENSLNGQFAFTSNDPRADISSGRSWMSMSMDPEISVNECMSYFGSMDFESASSYPFWQVGNATQTERKRKAGKEKVEPVKWDILRERVESENGPRGLNVNAMDSLDYEALRNADDSVISDAIKERGMSKMLAKRIKDFLNRLVEDHGKIDLEWLKDLNAIEGKEYLLSIKGLGLKSVECVRLLTLHQPAFPVDTNVARIAVRLGWVPLQPLPESLQLHLLEKYPVLDSIQKYLWPRLCKLDQETLYELHYQMITFGKVFCTKKDPNCKACPMRGECRHFASAFASARLALPGPEEKRTSPKRFYVEPVKSRSLLQCSEQEKETGPIIEEPNSPEPPTEEFGDIEDAIYEDPDEIPVLKLNLEHFPSNSHKCMKDTMEGLGVSRALVAMTPELASIPMPKLKHVSRLRTEHQVYELPDSHPLLKGMDRREPEDPSPYLLAIWTPEETPGSSQPSERKCSSVEGGPCNLDKCFSCNGAREADTQTVRGTILIPCRTAMRGSFPLNGTYFQVNELFADHKSSLTPIDVPRIWIWSLKRRTVYFGTSVSTILKGLSVEAIQFAFWKGFVCVRGFDRETRSPKPLTPRLHFAASKLLTQNEKRKNKAAKKV